jgi:hypothetical protein
MKKYLVLSIIIVVLSSCSSSKKAYFSQPLYEVLTGSDYGGANFKFYEIISQEDEFKILLSDDELKKFVKKDDIEKSNFILVNLGEKPSGGYTIQIVKVEETAEKVMVTLKENEPKSGEMVTSAITKPYFVLKINSKKPIEIK